MCWPSTVPHQACRMAPARRVCPILIVTLADQGNPALKPHPQEADQEAQVCEQDLRRLPGPQSRQGKVKPDDSHCNCGALQQLAHFWFGNLEHLLECLSVHPSVCPGGGRHLCSWQDMDALQRGSAGRF